MLDSDNLMISILLFVIFLLYPINLQAETMFFYNNKVDRRDVQDIIGQNPLGSEENIKSILIHKTEDVSIHLVQIRFKEKPHIHNTHDLIVTLKKGKGVLHLGNEALTMSEDDTALIPRGIVHYFENTGGDVAIGLGIFVPAYDGKDMIEVEKGKSLTVYPLTYVKNPPVYNYNDTDRIYLRQAIINSLSYLERINKDTEFNYGGRIARAKEVARTQRIFLQIIDNTESEEMFDLLMDYMFEWYKASGVDGKGTVVFTGYYVPEVEGRLSPSERYRYPLYRPPEDLIRDIPNYTREEIDGGRALYGKGLEIAWLADPVEAYFLHIQGSGIIRLSDGSNIGVHYAGNNGHTYKSIGKLLIDQGLISPDEGSLQEIKRFFRTHPEKIEEILYQNPRYIFFKIDNTPAKGSHQVTLTPGYSIATDPALFPRGGLSFIITKTPVVNSSGSVTGWRDLQRFVLNQDEGGGIKGPGRVDIFYGTGPDVGFTAGSMKEKGALYFLLQK